MSFGLSGAPPFGGIGVLNCLGLGTPLLITRAIDAGEPSAQSRRP